MLRKRHGFSIFLADLHHTRSGRCKPAGGLAEAGIHHFGRDYDPEIFEREVEEEESQLEHELIGDVITETMLGRVYDSNGYLLCKDIEVDEDDLLDADSYKDRGDHVEEYLGDLETRYIYTDHVVVIVPNHSLSKTVGTSRTANQDSVRGWLWFHARRCEEKVEPWSRDELRALVDKVATGVNHDDTTIIDAIELSMKYLDSDPRTILKLLLAIKGSMSETTIAICRDVIRSVGVDEIQNI